MSKVYSGIRKQNKTTVLTDSRELPLHLDIQNHSPSGFEWGYLDSGADQLALAILYDHFLDKGLALKYYQDFKSIVISNIQGDQWQLTTEEINSAIDTIKNNHAENKTHKIG